MMPLRYPKVVGSRQMASWCPPDYYLVIVRGLHPDHLPDHLPRLLDHLPDHLPRLHHQGMTLMDSKQGHPLEESK
jgi:hypothetical protein